MCISVCYLCVCVFNAPFNDVYSEEIEFKGNQNDIIFMLWKYIRMFISYLLDSKRMEKYNYMHTHTYICQELKRIYITINRSKGIGKPTVRYKSNISHTWSPNENLTPRYSSFKMKLSDSRGNNVFTFSSK